jgi:Domain of unknown function (DUF4266)
MVAVACACLLSACVVVPQNQRAVLADPLMTLRGEPMDNYRRQKIYTSREGAAGGDGIGAVGGCSCQ